MGWINDFALEQMEQQAPPRGTDMLGASLEVSSGLKADQAVRASRLAGELGATEDMVLAAPDESEREAISERIRAYPSLVNWAGRSAVNAAIAREEPDSLGSIIEGIKGTAAGAASFLPKVIGGFSKFGWDTSGYLWGLGESGASLIGLDGLSGYAKAHRKAAQDYALASSRFLAEERWNLPPELQGDISDHPEYLLSPTYLSHQFFDGLASMVPAVSMAYLSGGASVGAQALIGGLVGGAQEGTALYTELSAETDGDMRNVANLSAGASMTMGSGLLNSISFGKLFGAMRPGLRKKLLDVVEAGVTEGATEWGENPMSAFLASMARGDNAETTLENVWAAAKDLNVIPGAMLAGGGLRAGHIYMASREAQTFVDQQLEVNAKVTASQLYKQSPEKMRELLDSAGPIMSQIVTIPRAQVSNDVLAALSMEGESDQTISVSLSELHAKLTPEAFREVISLVEPVEGQSLVTARRKMKKALGDVIGQAVAARDFERAANAAMNLEDKRQATEDLRARVKAETEALIAGPADTASEGEGGKAGSDEQAAAPPDAGVAYADAQVVDRLMQTALEKYPEEIESLKAQLFDGLALAPDVYAEAVANGGSLEIYLSNLAEVVNNPLWNDFIGILESEPIEVTKEMQADLEAMGAPLAILDNAGSDVSPETRAYVLKGLKSVGRSNAQAARETEILARFASIRARIAGEDPNKMIRDTFRFGRESDGGGGVTYHQDAVKRRKFDALPIVELAGNEIFKLVEPVNLSEVREKALTWASENGLYREDYENTDTGWTDIALRKKGVEDSLRHNAGPAKIQCIAALPSFIRDGIFLETTPAHNEKQIGMKSHVFAAKVSLDGKQMAVGFIIKEDMNGRRFYDHELTKIGSLDEVVSHSGAAPKESGGRRSQPRQGLVMSIVQKHLGVKSDMTFEQSNYQQENKVAARGLIELMDDGSINIIFNQTQDVSTAVHEFAHAFRELVARTLALPAEQIADQAAFDSLKEGWEAAESWLARFDDDATLKTEYDQYQKKSFGGRAFEDLTADEKATVKRTAQHEYFARGFEAYLMEGTAPTKGLKKLFSQMKKWLTKVYKTALSLDVELNDDVRRFFDRLLATEEELALESWRAEAAPTPDQLEMMREVDPQAVADYEAAAAKGRQEAEAQLIQARMAEREKSIRQWRREGRMFAQEDERTRRISDIRQSGGISLDSLRALGYDKESINQLQKRFPGLVNSASRIGLDEHADNLGLDGGDVLFQELMATPTLTHLEAAYVEQQEAEWEAYFEADLGLTDAEIAAWDAEKNLWAKFMASKNSKYAPRPSRGLKAAIEAQFDGLTVDEIKRRNSEDLRANLKAQARAARDGYKAGENAGRTAGLMAGVAEGTRAGRREAQADARKKLSDVKAEGRASVNLAVAEARARALEERQEMALRLHFQAMRQREIMKFENKARRLIKQKVASSPYRRGGISPDFHYQIKNILAAAGLGRPVEAGEDLGAFIARIQADGAPVDVAPDIISGAIWQKAGKNGQITRRTYKGLTWEEFNDLKNAVENLAMLGRRQQQVRVAGTLMSEDAAAAEILRVIRANNEIEPEKTPAEIFSERETGKKKAWFKTWFKQNAGIMPSTRKMQHLAYELDGQKLNEFIQKALYLPANEAHNTAIKLTTEWMNELRDIAARTVGVEAFKSWGGELIFIPELNQSIKKSTIIMAALNYGNIQNAKALNNHQVFGKNLAPLFKRMTEKEWDYVQAIWDFFDKVSYPELNSLTLKTKGIPLPKVEARPFTVTLPNGQIKQMRGGYFPLDFDRELSTSKVIDSKINQAEIKNTPGLWTPSEVQSSSTIKRNGRSYRDLVPDLNMAVMIQSLNENIQDLAYREAINDIWRLLKRPDVKGAIEGVFGDEAWLQMKYWLRNLTRGGSNISEMKNANWIARKLRNNTSVNAMGAKMSVLALQVTGISQSAQTLGWGWTYQGIKGVFGHSSLAEIKKSINEMYAKSPQLAARNQRPYDRDMYDSIVKGKDPLFKTWFQQWGEALFKWIGLSDQMVANAVWMGAYQKALHEGKSEADAVMDADATISLTQSMGESKDMNYAQQGWAYGDMGKLVTMFQTFFSSTGNLFWLANRQAMREGRKGNYGKAIKGLFRANWNLAIIPAIFSTLMWNGFDWPDDDEEKDRLATDFARDIIGNMAGGLPLVRDGIALIADFALGTGEPRFAASPVEGAIVGTPRTIKAAYKAITEEDDRLTNIGRVARGIGPFVPGIPGAQIATTLEGIDNWDENDGLNKVYRLFIRAPK